MINTPPRITHDESARLDRTSALMARGLLSSARGLHSQIDRVDAPEEITVRAHHAVDRLVGSLIRAAEHGEPSAALGADNLAKLMTASEALRFDLSEMTEVVERETERLTGVHRPDAWDSEDPRAGEADLIVAKHRNGETRIIPVAHQLHYSRFTDLTAGT